MPHAIELPGSELRDVTREGTLVRVRLAAASARDAAGERGWLTGVTLTLAGATLDGDVTNAFGRIAAGALREGARELARVEVPGTLAGDLALTLHLANGAHVVIRADALHASVATDAHFQEDMSC